MGTNNLPRGVKLYFFLFYLASRSNMNSYFSTISLLSLVLATGLTRIGKTDFINEFQQ